MKEKESFGDWLATFIGKAIAWGILLLAIPWVIMWFSGYIDWVREIVK